MLKVLSEGFFVSHRPHGCPFHDAVEFELDKLCLCMHTAVSYGDVAMLAGELF